MEARTLFSKIEAPEGKSIGAIRATMSLHHEPSQSIPPPQRILDSLPFPIALLDGQGTILAVNQSWRAFGQANGANASDHFVGSNYLELCDSVCGIDAMSAQTAGDGI